MELERDAKNKAGICGDLGGVYDYEKLRTRLRIACKKRAGALCKRKKAPGLQKISLH